MVNSQKMKRCIKRCLAGFLAILLLNFSIDIPGTFSTTLNNNAYFDQESLLEVLAEEVLGFSNAFQDIDLSPSDEEPDSSPESAKLKAPFILNFQIRKTAKQITLRANYWLLNDTMLLQGFQQKDSPPPKFYCV